MTESAQPAATAASAPELEAARRLAPSLAAAAVVHERQGTFPYEGIEALKAAGLNRMTLAAELGGLGTPLPVMARTMRVLGAADAATSLAIVQHLGSVACFSVHATHRGHALLERYLRDEVAHDRLQALFAGAPEFEGREPARAVRIEGGFLLHGRKGFGTGVRAVAFGTGPFEWQRDDGERWTVLPIYRTDAPGFSIVEGSWQTFGMRPTLSDDLAFDGVFVPDDMVAWQGPDAQFPAFAVDLMRFGLITFAALYLGIADAAWAYLQRVVADRVQPGTMTPLLEQPGLPAFMGEIELLRREAGAFMEWTVHEHRDPLAWGPATLPAIASMKDSVTRSAVQIVERCMQALGGASYYTRVPLERYYRDVRAGPIHPINHPAIMAMLGKAAATG